MIDVNDKFTMVVLMLLSPYEKLRINSISAQFRIILSYLYFIYLDTVILLSDQH
jgi:hypothetical protein